MARAAGGGALATLKAALSMRASGREWAVLIAVLVTGFALRAYRIDEVGINHFDEGAYATSALGRTVPGHWDSLYPGQQLLSPPLFFTLTGAIFRVAGGPSHSIPIAINVLFGTATIALLWVVGRAWYGGAAGVAAAALIALDGLHLQLSRSGMTDVLFAFLFLAALFSIARTLERRRLVWALAAGVAVGLAWNTKYHGWLPIAVAAPAIVLAELLHGFDFDRLRSRVWLLAVTAAVALALYAPWALWVMGQRGGYAMLVDWHAGYLSAEWLANLREQIAIHGVVAGSSGRVSLVVALLATTLVAGTHARANVRLLAAALAAATAAVTGPLPVAVVLAVVAALDRLRRRGSMADAVAFVAVLVMFVLTPFYEPFARLVLPLMIVAYLLTGDWLARTVHATPVRRWSFSAIVLASAVAAAVVVWTPGWPLGSPWKPARGMERVAHEVGALVPDDGRVLVVLVPALAFYLETAGGDARAILHPSRFVDAGDGPLFVAAGRHARTNREASADIESLAGRLVEVGRFDIEPVDLEVLDSLGPDRAPAWRADPDGSFDVVLYRVSAGTSGAGR